MTEARPAFDCVMDAGVAEEDLGWVDLLVDLAHHVVTCYGPDALDYTLLQQEVCREQGLLAYLEQEAQLLTRETIRPLYRQLHPSRHLETIQGVGEGAAAV